MARRAAPPNSGPAYYAPTRPRAAIPDANESVFGAFIHDQIFSPEKLPGNINILTGIAVFCGGIFAFRTWGELMIPA